MFVRLLILLTLLCSSRARYHHIHRYHTANGPEHSKKSGDAFDADHTANGPLLSEAFCTFFPLIDDAYSLGSISVNIPGKYRFLMVSTINMDDASNMTKHRSNLVREDVWNGRGRRQCVR